MIEVVLGATDKLEKILRLNMNIILIGISIELSEASIYWLVPEITAEKCRMIATTKVW